MVLAFLLPWRTHALLRSIANYRILAALTSSCAASTSLSIAFSFTSSIMLIVNLGNQCNLEILERRQRLEEPQQLLICQYFIVNTNNVVFWNSVLSFEAFGPCIGSKNFPPNLCHLKHH